ncbi:hypothetical protein Y032_0070g493 [Ancylostoma ceylanicum]|uniref:Uncharacterized protein n=1 Tax=Ancylostoma ceylanicum TaxID=53326 RepID=A0A016TX09_9BILA|nr:hypothetical protein Y032_0070g493 [Ancylostoma ceylanicum]
MAQPVERLTISQAVAGSSPVEIQSSRASPVVFGVHYLIHLSKLNRNKHLFFAMNVHQVEKEMFHWVFSEQLRNSSECTQKKRQHKRSTIPTASQQQLKN